jgi:ribosome maturation factor RimP
MGPSELDVLVYTEIGPIINGMGFEVVELKCIRTKTGVRVFIVIYRHEGVDLESCSEVLKTIRPRIQIIADNPDVHIEVSSPGTARVLKDRREYRIFQGRGLKVLLTEMDDWTGGVLFDVMDSGIVLTKGGTSKTITFDDIRKAKLDYAEEVDT